MDGSQSEGPPLAQNAAPPNPGKSVSVSRNWRTGATRFLLPLIITGLLGTQAFLFWQVRNLREELATERFNSEVNRLNADDDVITPSVGSIQFLKSGYTVSIESLSYSSAGIQLSGLIGNPRLLNLSSLTLELTAQRPRWGRRKDWETNPFDFTFDHGFGTAEVAVGDLRYGQRAAFHAVIPNVKQEKDSSFVIKVGFKGERFAFPF